MDAESFSNFKRDPKKYMKQVNDNCEPLIVTSHYIDDTVVVIGKSEYDSLISTVEIQSNPYLMDKIHSGEMEFMNNEGQTHDIFIDEK
ncbi:type II toxin-antitoxin system Phd/YefM family antitoxin [Companilactobacillus ginsenosidimutans]|uniref:Antitoxin n=1 Tax=Companilactobacillus ginsenosidimutans TaxID=1007676 RepID=A0A0H4R2G5_9LACO|nr:type II toxin-antitoxin system Phd/YefM family antitoxin [Companilactobacillus ginsenosidimutans]AKP67915.1 hypothetical protein ABM34_10490 [Companilactobacillus ginsenosidimutans]